MWESRSLPAFFFFARRLRRRLQKNLPVTYRVRACQIFFWLLASIHAKTKKGWKIFDIEMCNSLGKPPVSFGFAEQLRITNYALRIKR